MAEERDQDAPSLEPPSLFGRKKKRKSPPDREEPARPATEAVAEPVGGVEPVEPVPPVPPAEPVAAAEPGVATPDAEPAAAPSWQVSEQVDVVQADEAVTPVEPHPPVEPVSTTEPVPPVEAVPRTEPPAPVTGAGATAAGRPGARTNDPILGVPDPSPRTVVDQTPVPTGTPSSAPVVSDEPATPRAPRTPWLTGRPAAALTGLLVGALIVAATAGSLRLCTGIKGTSSCGGPGLFLLIAILVVAVLVGTALLRAALVPEPGSTSFLAVGLLSVVTLLFLVGSIFQWWMVIVIPLVSVATFLLSHWVTTTYIEPDAEVSERQRQPEVHDIR